MPRHRNEFPVEGALPAFDGATAWVNSEPITRGRDEGVEAFVFTFG